MRLLILVTSVLVMSTVMVDCSMTRVAGTTDRDTDTTSADGEQDGWYRVEVLGSSISCAAWDVQFLEKRGEVAEILAPGSSASAREGIYVARELPEEYQEEGIIIEIRFKKPEESMVCNTLGPSWYHLVVLDVKS